MNTDTIQRLIDQYSEDPETHSDLAELLSAVAEQQGASANPAELAQGVAFVLDYVRQVPYMFKVAHTAAVSVGLEMEVDRILGAARSYWEQGNDVIPDHIGIIGLMDDAYCSLSLLQNVSDHYQLQTGKYLFPTNLSSANRLMRTLIGEPYVSELDNYVMQCINDARVIDAVKSMASREKQLAFEIEGTIWSHDPASAMDTGFAGSLGIDLSYPAE